MKKIEFYWDPISPYVYLAWTALPAFLRETGAELVSRPVLFAGLLNAHGSKGPAEIPAKRRYVFKDAMRWAQHDGVPFVGPPFHPFNPLLPLRMALAIEGKQQGLTWINALLKAAWVDSKDISSPEVLVKLADEAGLPGKDLLEKANQTEVKEALKKNTEEAIQRGIFGVPTFWVDGEIFWGNDRLPLLKDFLAGKNSVDSVFFEEMMARPTGVQRKGV